MSEVELARLRVKDEGPLETDNLLIFVQGSKNTFLRRKKFKKLLKTSC